MKFGIHFSYWSKEWAVDYHPYIDKAAELGFDALEISCSGMACLSSEYELIALKDHAAQKQLQLTAGYGPSPHQNLCAAQSAITDSAIAYFTETLPKLQKLGIQLLSGPLYAPGSMLPSRDDSDKKSDRKRSILNLQTVARIAQDCGITLNLEVVNRYEGTMMNTCAQGLDFIGAIGRKNIKLLLDTFHMNIEEDGHANAIRLAASQLGHLHVSEQNRRVPGQGTIPWAEIGNALRDISYDGTVVIESFVRSGGAVGQKIMLWRDLIDEPSIKRLDQDAKASLDFLRRIF